MSIDVQNTLGVQAGTWNIDPSHSEIGFTARHLMSKVRGLFEKFEGQIVTGEQPIATATVDLNSINTRDENRDAHLRSGDFFDVEKHPTITFKSTRIERSGDEAKIHGNLTMRGVTRPVVITGEFLGTQGAEFQRVGFEGDVTVNRKDWGVSWNAALDTGGVLVSEKVTLEFEVSAIRTDAT